MFNEALSYLGGLLGFNQQSPEALNPMAAGYQGAEANPGRTEFTTNQLGAFGQYTPEQRRQLGLAYLADTASQLSGREGNAAQSLMRAFNLRAGGGPVMPQMQAPQAMQVAPMVQLQAPTMRMPQMQMGMQRPGVSSYLLG